VKQDRLWHGIEFVFAIKTTPINGRSITITVRYHITRHGNSHPSSFMRETSKLNLTELVQTNTFKGVQFKGLLNDAEIVTSLLWLAIERSNVGLSNSGIIIFRSEKTSKVALQFQICITDPTISDAVRFLCGLIVILCMSVAVI